MGRPIQGKTYKYLTRYTNFFADLCLQDYKFHGYSPSILAASIVVSARRAMGVTPLWVMPAMDSVFCYSRAAVAPVFDEVWALYVATFPTEAREMLAHEAARRSPCDPIGLTSPLRPATSTVEGAAPADRRRGAGGRGAGAGGPVSPAAVGGSGGGGGGGGRGGSGRGAGAGAALPAPPAAPAPAPALASAPFSSSLHSPQAAAAGAAFSTSITPLLLGLRVAPPSAATSSGGTAISTMEASPLEEAGSAGRAPPPSGTVGEGAAVGDGRRSRKALRFDESAGGGGASDSSSGAGSCNNSQELLGVSQAEGTSPGSAKRLATQEQAEREQRGAQFLCGHEKVGGAAAPPHFALPTR